MEGLHTELPEEQLGAPMVRRVQHLWWTIYIIDCYFSSSVGIPITVYDNDEVTTPLGSLRDSSQRDTALSLQVKLSHLLSTVISSKSIDKF
jgi:proline utilization trans-activator